MDRLSRIAYACRHFQIFNYVRDTAITAASRGVALPRRVRGARLLKPV